MAALVNYEWPGNVRELENAIERALVMGASDMVLLEDLPESLLEQASPAEMHEGKYHASVKELKKQLILDAVEQTRGNYVEAAGILGVHPNYLHRLIRNLGAERRTQQELRPRGKQVGWRGVTGRCAEDCASPGEIIFRAMAVAIGARDRDRFPASARLREGEVRWRGRCRR